MQSIHFWQMSFVEYRDNYYNFPEAAYIIGSKCRYERRFSLSWFKHMRVKVEVIGQSLIFAKSPCSSSANRFYLLNHAKQLSTLCYNALEMCLLSGDTFSS